MCGILDETTHAGHGFLDGRLSHRSAATAATAAGVGLVVIRALANHPRLSFRALCEVIAVAAVLTGCTVAHILEYNLLLGIFQRHQALQRRFEAETNN